MFSGGIERDHSAGIYLLKVNNRNTRTSCEICLKLTIKIPERRHWRCSGIFIVSFEYISHLFLVFLLLTLNMKLLAGQQHEMGESTYVADAAVYLLMILLQHFQWLCRYRKHQDQGCCYLKMAQSQLCHVDDSALRSNLNKNSCLFKKIRSIKAILQKCKG